MNIISQSRPLTKVELYRMTKDAGVMALKDCPDGMKITPDAVLVYEDGGNEVMAILDKETGYTVAFQSATARRTFEEIAEIFGGEEFSVVKQSGVSKAGRAFCIFSLAI